MDQDSVLHPLLDGLPSIVELLSPKDVAQTFNSLQKWIKCVAAQGQIDEAGRRAGHGHRCALLAFMNSQTEGIRQSRAREIIKLLHDSPEWADEMVLGANELASAAEEASTRPPPFSAKGGAAWDARIEEYLRDLPSKSSFEHQGICASDTFRSLQKWVKAKRQVGKLAEAATMIDSGYRRSIISFTCTFANEKPVYRSRAQEVLRELAREENWCQDDAMEQAVRAELLMAKPSSSMASLAVPIAPRPRSEPSPPNPRSCADQLGGVEEPASELFRCSSSPDFSQCVEASTRSPADPIADWASQAIPLSEHVDLFKGLPSRRFFEDATLHGRGGTGVFGPGPITPRTNSQKEVFQTLRSWVRAKKQTGTLAAAGALMDEEFRRSIMLFLSAFIARKTVFREQARGIYEQLVQCWTSPDKITEGRTRSTSVESTVSTGSTVPPSMSITSSSTESSGDLMYRGHCDKCKRDLVMGPMDWYHKRGSYEDLCHTHWQELAEVERATFIIVSDATCLAGEEAEYKQQESEPIQKQEPVRVAWLGLKARSHSRNLYLTPFLDTKFKGLRIFRHVFAAANRP